MARHQDTELEVRERVQGVGGWWFWKVGEACGSDLMPCLIVFDIPFDENCHDGQPADHGRLPGN